MVRWRKHYHYDGLKFMTAFSYKLISDQKARKLMTKFILKKRKAGITKLGTLDFMSSDAKLGLSANQIDRIMKQFEKEGKVKEIQ